MSQRSDKVLVNRVLKGDREACGQLVRCHYAPVYQLLMHLCRNTHLPEDLSQETFAAAWKSISTFAGVSSLRTWLHQIAYCKFIDSCRCKQHIPSNDSDIGIHDVEAKNSDPLDEVMASDDSWQLLLAVDCLKPAEKSVIELHCLQGLTFQQSGRGDGEPPGTIRWRSRQALESLKQKLNAKEEHGSRPSFIS